MLKNIVTRIPSLAALYALLTVPHKMTFLECSIRNESEKRFAITRVLSITALDDTGDRFCLVIRGGNLHPSTGQLGMECKYKLEYDFSLNKGTMQIMTETVNA